jgi:chaperonin GroEL
LGTDSDKIKQIASISANNDEVSDLIATAFAKVGKRVLPLKKQGTEIC